MALANPRKKKRRSSKRKARNADGTFRNPGTQRRKKSAMPKRLPNPEHGVLSRAARKAAAKRRRNRNGTFKNPSKKRGASTAGLTTRVRRLETHVGVLSRNVRKLNVLNGIRAKFKLPAMAGR